MTHFVQRAGRLALALVAVGSVALSSCKSDSTTTVYGNWTSSSPFGGVARSQAVSFTINNIAYVGTGADINGTKTRDLWAFNPTTGGWLRQADMPTAAGVRQGGVAFAANGKGYVGTGRDVSNVNLSDFWEFTPSSTGGSWKQVASLPSVANPGNGRYGALAATYNNVGYVGFGFDGNNESDLFAFTPPTTANPMGVWTQAPAFPGQKRINGVAFVVNNNLYVATGINNAQNVTDVWAFNGTTWSQKASLINKTTDPTYDYSAVARANSVAFTIGNYAYVATGSTRQDCYQYDPSADTWTKMNPFLGAARNYGVGFGIGNFGYVGLGTNGGTPFDDFYQLDPSVVQQ